MDLITHWRLQQLREQRFWETWHRRSEWCRLHRVIWSLSSGTWPKPAPQPLRLAIDP